MSPFSELAGAVAIWRAWTARPLSSPPTVSECRCVSRRSCASRCSSTASLPTSNECSLPRCFSYMTSCAFSHSACNRVHCSSWATDEGDGGVEASFVELGSGVECWVEVVEQSDCAWLRYALKSGTHGRVVVSHGVDGATELAGTPDDSDCLRSAGLDIRKCKWG